MKVVICASVAKVVYIITSLRWKYFLNWYSYFLGYFIIVGFRFGEHFLRAAIVFIAMGPIFYSGIYYINDIFDRNLDKLDSKRKKRPLASGSISISQAYILTLIFLISGLLLLYFLKKDFVIWALVILLINLFYTLFAKKIPYLELIVNVIPHSLRFYLGLLMAGSSSFQPLILTITLFSAGVGLLRHYVQISKGGHISRPVLKWYTQSGINVLLLSTLMMLFITSFFLTGINREVSFFFSYFFILLLLVNFYARMSFTRNILNLLD